MVCTHSYFLSLRVPGFSVIAPIRLSAHGRSNGKIFRRSAHGRSLGTNFYVIWSYFALVTHALPWISDKYIVRVRCRISSVRTRLYS